MWSRQFKLNLCGCGSTEWILIISSMVRIGSGLPLKQPLCMLERWVMDKRKKKSIGVENADSDHQRYTSKANRKNWTGNILLLVYHDHELTPEILLIPFLINFFFSHLYYFSFVSGHLFKFNTLLCVVMSSS